MQATHANVGFRLHDVAASRPEQAAVVELGSARSATQARMITFAQLERDSERLAAGLRAMGIPAGSRLVLAVPPGIDFVSTVVAMLKARLVMVLIDPGMPREHLVTCLSEAEPDGFIAPPKLQLARWWLRQRFPRSRYHVVAGPTWCPGVATLDRLRRSEASLPDETCSLDDQAAIIFTTGSTGPPKGVRYDHRQFARQIDEIRERFGLEPGRTDLAAFPLFGLFNCMMGTTTLFPAMDYTRPAEADPAHIVEAIREWKVTQSFGSPAFWNTVASYVDRKEIDLAPLKHVFSAGAPVPVHVLERIVPRLADGGDVWTPYGATEALPVAAISGREILGETAALTRVGKGTCVGTRFPGIDWKVIEIRDDPIEQLEDAREVEQGQIGELIVRGDVVTREYVTRVEANALHKITDGRSFWHRMGDVGYLDERERFWFCGRKSHRVVTRRGTLFTVPCESIFNNHPRVYRSALVGIGQRPDQRPVVIVEPWPGKAPAGEDDWQQLRNELRALAESHESTQGIVDFYWRPTLPTDIRHNAKIFREKLVTWVEQQESS